MAIETGGPALPVDEAHSNFDGMTLRDYFAAKAMAAYISHPESVGLTEENIAKCAYDMADAMLEASK